MDLVLEIFASPIYEQEVSAAAVEACAFLGEFPRPRAAIIESGSLAGPRSPPPFPVLTGQVSSLPSY